MKHFLSLIFSLCLVAVGSLAAVELSDVSPTLTRTMADNTLTKDYKYRVLSDMTVRRIWNLDDNRKLTLDFHASSDKLLMAMVEYRKAVSPKQASRDARQLSGAGKAKWKKMDSKRVKKYDVARNSRNAKLGDCYGFMEMNASDKCSRVMVYTSLPTENRRHLKDADLTDGGVTALGARAGSSLGKTIAEQEERRLKTPASSSSVAVRRPAAPAASTVPAVADDASDSLVDEEDAPEEAIVESTTVLDQMLEKVGLGGVSPVMLIGGVVGLIVLLALIGAIRRFIARRRMARFLAEAEAAELEEVRNARRK